MEKSIKRSLYKTDIPPKAMICEGCALEQSRIMPSCAEFECGICEKCGKKAFVSQYKNYPYLGDKRVVHLMLSKWQ